MTVSERFAEIDAAFMESLGFRVVDQIMIDICNPKFSLRQVADQNKVRCADVAQVCRFHEIDVNGNKLTH